MTFISTRSYKILTPLLPVLVLLCAYSLLEKEINAIFSHVESIGTVSTKIRKTGTHIRELPEMKADFENLARKQAAIASSLFGSESESGLYELLMLKARDADVSIVSMTPRPRRAGTGFSELPLSLEVSGPYDNIARFTGMIENVHRLMRVDEFSMGKDRDGRIVAEIRLLVYMYADTGATPPSATKSKLEAAFQKRENYLAELQNVLQVQMPPPVFAYSPSGKSDPFGSFEPDRRTVRTAPSSDDAKRNIGMTLKGILWKDPPLAILETLDGRSFIVKKGETVNGFTVSSIGRTEVTIATPQGNHVLYQYSDQ